MATSYYDNIVRAGLTENEEATHQMLKDLSKVPYQRQKALVRQSLDRQLSEMFVLLKQTGGMDPYPQPLRDIGSTPTEQVLNKLSKHKEREKRRDTEILEKEITHFSRAFSLYIRKSTIEHPEAGLGKGVDPVCSFF